ncbi:MAG TPA: hypothetical protein VIK04_16755, partial [Solirubrobacteraceae bacterium]
MSDSLKATVIVIVPVLTISAKPVEDDELLEVPLDPPRLPALLVPALDELDDPFVAEAEPP